VETVVVRHRRQVVSVVASTVGSPGVSPVAINPGERAALPHRDAESGLAILPTSLHHFGVRA
jgi:hypothetical protein